MTRADNPIFLPPAPAVSVIVPAYNAATTIRATLESVLAQTLTDFEAIVVDDGSSDATAEIARAVADARIAVHRFSNAGAAKARNRGLALSRGEFIAFLDADDLWTPEKLQLQVDALRRRPDAGVAYSWVVFVDEAGRSLFPRRAVHFEGDVLPHLLVDCFLATASNPVLRRACVESTGQFDTTLTRAEDWDYWLRAARHWPFVVVPRYQTRYRVTQNALSAEVEPFVADTTRVLDRAFAAAPASLQQLKPRALASFDRYTAFIYLTRAPVRGWRRLAARQLLRALRRRPAIVLERETLNVSVAWLVALAPGPLGQRAVRALVRLHGRRGFRRPAG